MSILDTDADVPRKINDKIKERLNGMNVIRTFHSVGQGGFYTETFDDKDDKHIVVYDCGGNSSESMEKYLDSLFPKNQEQQIDAVFVSHLHDDHINGLQYLFDHKHKYIHVKRLFLPQFSTEKVFEVLLYNAINSLGFTKINDFIVELNESVQNGGMYGETRIVTIDEADDDIDNRENTIQDIPLDTNNQSVRSGYRIRKDIWRYIPYNAKTPKPIWNNLGDSELQSELKRIYDLPIKQQANEIVRFVERHKVETCKMIYEALYKSIHNGQSMTVFSGLLKKDINELKIYSNLYEAFCHCIFAPYNLYKNDKMISTNFLYTGDFEAKSSKNMSALELFYKRQGVWDTICGIQIPHHGSRNNYNEELYKGRYFAVASAGAESQYGHPNIDTMTNIAQQDCMPLLVTEHKNTIIFQQFKTL